MLINSCTGLTNSSSSYATNSLAALASSASAATTNSSSNYNNNNTSSTNTKSGSSKEQTEPVDFSSGFSTAFGSRSGSSATADLSRFRANASGYSSFPGLTPAYNSLLQNGYSSSGYGYNNGYGCLNYGSSSFSSDAASSFGLPAVLGGAGTTARYIDS